MIYPSFVSTAAMAHETTLSIKRVQNQLVEAQTELSTGRHADAGLKLGAMTGVTVSFRQEKLQLTTIRETNTLVDARLTATQGALQSISDLSQNFLSVLLRAKSTQASPGTIAAEAKSGFEAFMDTLNSSMDGQHLFSGVNTDVHPFEDYFGSPAPASRQAIAAAFQTEFGFSQNSPSAQSVDGAAMTSFLNGAYAAEFGDPKWATNWSAASDRNVRNRISRSELVDVSTNANRQVFRDLAAAYTMVSDLGFDGLNEGARNAIVDKAISLASAAVGGVANIQSELGVVQERVTYSSNVIDSQLGHLEKIISDIESVDPNEVALRVSTLMTQMESAYSVTRRLLDLSIMKFL